ncbi:MAG: cellulase family glycosylhydrolase, partial [Erysipelotrichaceae bacterium]|nr:cellulase family glycosylhydrolase [Erysipelotrichaceae bacterium]
VEGNVVEVYDAYYASNAQYRYMAETLHHLAKPGVEPCLIAPYAPETKILVGGYHNNSIAAIKDLDEPYDKNIVYNFHCYSPLVFTHQGAYWIDNMKPDFRLPFENTYGDYIKATRENVFEGFEDHFKKEEEMIDVSYFTDMFKEAVEIAQKYGVPLYCGEFGVIDRADTTESEKWFECITKAFDQFDIGRALWSYKEMDFGLVDAHYDGIRNKIIELV